MIFVALLLVSGSGAYAYTEGAFDEILELNEDEEIVEDVIKEEPVVVETDLAAFISVNTNLGTNFYSMEEVDDGDNNEVEEIVWDNFTFQFDASESIGNIENYTWEFGDGNMLYGIEGAHSYELPGNYLVTLTVTSFNGNDASSQTEIAVNFDGFVISDNMECTCAPTGKDTVIDLVVLTGKQSIQGFVQVEHDGSSESCTLRNPLQECHIRVILQRTELGAIVSEEILFDDTFRSNEKIVDFQLSELEFSQGESVQLRLETDQIRDWHKPTAEWSITIPS